MKTRAKMSAVVLIAIVGGLAWTLPVMAEKAVLSDGELDQITAGGGSGSGSFFVAVDVIIFGLGKPLLAAGRVVEPEPEDQP